MPNSFDELAAIIGPVMTTRVMDKMGGRIVRIRKNFISYDEAYRDEQILYDSYTLKAAATRLGCTPSTIARIRRRIKDQL